MQILYNGKKLPFNVTNFLQSSAKITDITDFSIDCLRQDEYQVKTIPLFDIKPIVNQLNIQQIYLEIARCLTDKPMFVVTSDLYCVSNNNKLAIQYAINDLNSVNNFQCAVLNQSLSELYGLNYKQDVNDSGELGMGNVAFPEVAAADTNFNVAATEKGSGDEVHNFVTYSMLAAYRGKTVDDMLNELHVNEAQKLTNYTDKGFPSSRYVAEVVVYNAYVESIGHDVDYAEYLDLIKKSAMSKNSMGAYSKQFYRTLQIADKYLKLPKLSKYVDDASNLDKAIEYVQKEYEKAVNKGKLSLYDLVTMFKSIKEFELMTYQYPSTRNDVIAFILYMQQTYLTEDNYFQKIGYKLDEDITLTYINTANKSTIDIILYKDELIKNLYGWDYKAFDGLFSFFDLNKKRIPSKMHTAFLVDANWDKYVIKDFSDILEILRISTPVKI